MHLGLRVLDICTRLWLRKACFTVKNETQRPSHLHMYISRPEMSIITLILALTAFINVSFSIQISYVLKICFQPLVASVRCLCPCPTQASWFLKIRPQNQHVNVGCRTMLSDGVGTTVYFLPHTLLSLSFKLNLSLTLPTFGHSLL